MDFKTSLLLTIALGPILIWASRRYQAIARNLWSHLFGVEYLVYSIGTGYHTLASEVHTSRIRQEESLRVEEASQAILAGVHSEFGADLGYLKRKVAKIDFREDAASSSFKGAISGQRDEIRKVQQTVNDIRNRIDCIGTIVINTQRLLTRAAARTVRAPPNTQTQAPFQSESFLEEINPFIDEVSQGTEESTLFNDYSGNEEPAPDSPPGSILNLQGEQETSSETSTEDLSSTSQTSGEGDSARIRWAIGDIIRRDIQRAIDSDSSSSESEESVYPNSDETDSD